MAKGGKHRLANYSGLWLPTAEPIRQRFKPFRKPSFFMPGCAPCCSQSLACEAYYTDDFNRANSTNLGADWIEDAGNWEIKDNCLWTTSAHARVRWHVIAETDAFDNSINGYGISCTVRAEESGTQAGIIVGGSSDFLPGGFYNASVIDFAAQALKVYEYGVLKKLRYIDAPLGEAIPLFLCYEGLIDQWYTDVNGTPHCVPQMGAFPFNATYFGFMTGGSVGTSGVWFDNMKQDGRRLDGSESPCPACPFIGMAGCRDGGPQSWKLVLQSMCAAYSGLNGTYYLPRGATTWEYVLPTPVGAAVKLVVAGTHDTGGDTLYVRFNSTTSVLGEWSFGFAHSNSSADCGSFINKSPQLVTLNPSGCTLTTGMCLLSIDS